MKVPGNTTIFQLPPIRLMVTLALPWTFPALPTARLPKAGSLRSNMLQIIVHENRLGQYRLMRGRPRRAAHPTSLRGMLCDDPKHSLSIRPFIFMCSTSFGVSIAFSFQTDSHRLVRSFIYKDTQFRMFFPHDGSPTGSSSMLAQIPGCSVNDFYIEVTILHQRARLMSGL